MENWKDVLVSNDITIRQILSIIDEYSLTVALVVDKQEKLLGVITDGDIRRGLINGVDLGEPVSKIMSKNPLVVSPETPKQEILNIMNEKWIRQIPIVDESGIVTGLALLDLLVQPEKQDNWVVFMAGGLGTRLRPLTKDVPKPLLKIGEKPIIHILLDEMKKQGFENFYISINYKAEMIEDYLGNGSEWGVKIKYLQEKEKLGTAGALSLFSERPSDSFFIINGDILTKVNLEKMLHFHNTYKGVGTMGVREYEFQVPYGVVNSDGRLLTGLIEKPNQYFYVNAGVYLLDPICLDFVPNQTYFDMTDLFKSLLDANKRMLTYPIREYWIDIGHLSDYEKAVRDYGANFF